MAADRISVLVKFPPALLAIVDARAKADRANRMATILKLVEQGEAVTRVLASVPQPKAPVAQPSETNPEPDKAQGFTVPLFGTFSRKPIPKTLKKR